MSKIYVVGLGPGGLADMTIRAKEVLDKCEIIVGYKTYIDSIKPLLNSNKQYILAIVKKELECCAEILKIVTSKNENVCLINNGDSGIYGMAGIIIEELTKHPEIEIEVVPGVTVITAAAALVGAPIMNDFSVISLNDEFNEWNLIEKRIELASKGDFVIGLYNPKILVLQRVVEIIMRYRTYTAPVAVVRNAGIEGESYNICMLAELKSQCIDQSTVIIIGNSKTYISNNKMVTPRSRL